MVGSDSACSELEFQVTGMMCEANCAARVKRACEALPGVESANVDFHTGTVRIHPKKNTLSNDIDPVCQSSEPAIPIMDMISLGIAVDQAGYSAMWAGGRRVIRFNIEGMTCGHCVNTVQDALAASGLVMQARVSLDHHCVNIIGDENTDIPAIINLIEDIGYGASVADGNREVDLTTKKMTYRDASVAFSALRAVPGVVCVQITPDRGVIRTRGFASVQSLVLALKSIGVEAKADASSLSPTSTGSASIEARHDVKGPSDSKPLRAAQEVQPVGYIADTKSTFEIKGMTCGACVASVEKAIQKLEGVKQVYVALLTETAEVLYDGKLVNWKSIFAAIDDAGYKPRHISTSSSALPSCEKRLFSVICTRSATLSSQFNITSLTSKHIGILSMHWVQLNEDGQTSPRSQPPTFAQGRTSSISSFVVSSPLVARAGKSSSVSSSSSLLRPPQAGTPTSYGSLTPSSHRGEVDESSSFGRDGIETAWHPSVTEKATLEVSFDPHLTGLRSIMEGMAALNPEFIIKLIPKKDFRSDIVLSQRRERNDLRRLFITALVFNVPIAIIMWADLFMHDLIPGLAFSDVLIFLLATPVQIICGARFYKEAHRGLKTGSLGMGFLIALGTSCSYLFGIFSVLYSVHNYGWTRSYPDNFMTAAMLLMFVLLGKTLEAEAKARTSSALETLIGQQAKNAILLEARPVDASKSEQSSHGELKEGEYEVVSEREIPTELIQHGDLLKVVRGMTCPADGIVVSGNGEMNEALITGEVFPVVKNIDDHVIGGAILKEGMIHFRVTEVGEKSVLHQIISLVENAQMQKAPIQQSADKIAGVFAVIVTGIAVCVFFVWYGLLKFDVIERTPELYLAGSDFVVAFTFAISTLVVACPCAMGLATPTAIMVGTGVGARLGVLIKGGETLETAYKVDTILFDKTGTLTIGYPKVTRVVTLGVHSAEPPSLQNADSLKAGAVSVPQSGKPRAKSDLGVSDAAEDIAAGSFDSAVSTMSQNLHRYRSLSFSKPKPAAAPAPAIEASVPHALQSPKFVRLNRSDVVVWYAACAELNSEHIIGRSIVQYAGTITSLPALSQPTNFVATSGRGIKCTVDSVEVLVGNLEFMRDSGINNVWHGNVAQYSIEADNNGSTSVYVAVSGSLEGLIELSDPPREEALATVKSLQSSGLECWMVTGDRLASAKSVARMVGIPSHNLVAEALPSTKIQHVKWLQERGKIVAFVGDGINDAPALVQADVGIAMGGGTDVAMESADMVLMKTDLSSVAVAIDLSREIVKCIKRNLFWALLYNIVAIPVAAGALFPVFEVIVPPWIAGAAMAMSSVSVILSSLSLYNYKPSPRATAGYSAFLVSRELHGASPAPEEEDGEQVEDASGAPGGMLLGRMEGYQSASTYEPRLGSINRLNSAIRHQLEFDDVETGAALGETGYASPSSYGSKSPRAATRIAGRNAASSPTGTSNFAAIPMAPGTFGGRLSRENSFAEVDYTAVRSAEPPVRPKAPASSVSDSLRTSPGSRISYALAGDGDV